MVLRSPLLAWVAGFALLATGTPGHSFAQMSDRSESALITPTPPRVDVSIVQDACDVGALQTKILSWFAPSDTRVSARREASLEPRSILAQSAVAGVRVWILAHTATTVWLYLAVQREPSSMPRYLVRDLDLDGGFDELGMEQLAQVVYLSSLALWTGQAQSTQIQLEERLALAAPLPRRDEPWQSPGSLAPWVSADAKSKSASSRRLGLMLHSEIGYGLRLQGHEGVAQGPLGAISVVSARRNLELGGRLVVQLFLPRQQHSGPVELDLRGYSLHIAPWLSRRDAGGISLTAEVGPGVDIIRYAVTSSADPSLRTAGSKWEARPIAWLAIGLEGEWSRIRLGVQASLATQFLRTHYDLVDGGQHVRLLTSWMVQPGISAFAGF